MSTAHQHIPNENREKGAHILAIRLSAMGDVAMTVPVITAEAYCPELSRTGKVIQY